MPATRNRSWPTQASTRASVREATRARDKLAEDIERLCTDAGISCAALARAASVDPGYLSRILARRATPTLEIYARLAVALGADLATRLYPNTGPAIRDRHQARILEALLAVAHPRWRASTEVKVVRPARGWIDLVFEERRELVVIATEIESQFRRIEQLVRWGHEKAASLPSSPIWPAVTFEGAPPPRISQLLIVRRSRSNREIAAQFMRQLAVAYPAHPEDALAALSGTTPWPGNALVWARIDTPEVLFLSAR